jgi:hypothetical protein
MTGSLGGMRRFGLGLMVIAVLVLPASAMAGQSGVSGSLYDTTCGSGCATPCPPPCGPVQIICAAPRQQAIVCPEVKRTVAVPAICLSVGCGMEFPLYEGTDATITVRRAGSAKVMRTVVPQAGKFSIPLGPGRYALSGHVAQPCWVGEKQVVTVTRNETATVALDVHDNCVAHPDTAG